jgi:hypothetical protein
MPSSSTGVTALCLNVILGLGLEACWSHISSRIESLKGNMAEVNGNIWIVLTERNRIPRLEPPV